MSVLPNQLAALALRRRTVATRTEAASCDVQEHIRRRDTFQEIYRRRIHETPHGSRLLAGANATWEASEFYGERMAELLYRHSCELRRPVRVVDLGCGDFCVAKALVDRLPEIAYLGCDIVPEIVAYNSARYATDRVQFRTLDAVCSRLPEADICLVRQFFEHLKPSEVKAVVQAMRYPIAYVTEHAPYVPGGIPAYEVFRFGEGRQLLVTQQLILGERAKQRRLSQSAGG